MPRLLKFGFWPQLAKGLGDVGLGLGLFAASGNQQHRGQMRETIGNHFAQQAPLYENPGEVQTFGENLAASAKQNYAAADALSGTVTRPASTSLLGNAMKWIASKAPTQLAASAASTPVPSGSLMSVAGLARGAGAGVATMAANAVNSAIPGAGNPNTPGGESFMDDAMRGVRLTGAGAVGGAPLGPWGVVTGAVTNPASHLVGDIKEISRLRESTAWTEGMADRLAKGREARWSEIGGDSATKALMYGTAGVLGITAIGRLIAGLRNRNKRKEESQAEIGSMSMPNFAPKFAKWVWQQEPQQSSTMTPPAPAAPMAQPAPQAGAQPAAPAAPAPTAAAVPPVPQPNAIAPVQPLPGAAPASPALGAPTPGLGMPASPAQPQPAAKQARLLAWIPV